MKKYVITLIVSVFVAISGAVNAQLVKQKQKWKKRIRWIETGTIVLSRRMECTELV